MSGDIVGRLRNWDDGRVSTHYEGCWDSHPVCAILLAADAIEARDATIATLTAEIERLRSDLKHAHAEIDHHVNSIVAERRLADQLAEVERLRAGLDDRMNEVTRLWTVLHLAAGLLTAMEPYGHMHPEQMLTFLQTEARRD